MTLAFGGALLKPLLLMLPGMMCDEWLFGPQAAALCQSHEICVAKLTGADTIECIARRVLNRVPRSTFSVMGASMGGIVAMELMRTVPERIERVVLLSTTPAADPPELRALRRRQMQKVRAGRMFQVIAEEIRPNHLAAENSENAELHELLTDMAADLGEDAFLSQSLALMIRRDYTDTLRRWQKPTMLICGYEDVLCTPEEHQGMAAMIKDCRLHVIKCAGHITTLEQPREVNQLITTFLGTEEATTTVPTM